MTSTTLGKIRVTIYIRVSDPSQIDNNSLETQLKACLDYAKNHNMEVVRIFREEGISAKHVRTRPELKNLLEFCSLKKNKISSVIVYKMDRWSRNVEEGLLAESFLAKYGISLLPVAEITEQSPMAKAMRTLLMTFGQLENELKGERVRDNMKTMFRNGLWCWKPRIGYKKPFLTKEENKGKAPIIDLKIGEIIIALFNKASQSPVSKKFLAEYINKLGFKEAYGEAADGRMISRLISETFYYGYMYSPTWKEYQWGKHEPLIDRDTWDKANINLFGRKRKYNMQDSAIFPLKGLLRCFNCKNIMTSSNPRGTSKNYLYYECHNGKCIKRERIALNTANQEFIKLLGLTKPSPRVLKLFVHLVFSEWENSIGESKREAKIIDEQISKLESKLTAIAESNSKHILTDSEAINRAEEVRKDIAVLRIERADIRIDQYSNEAVKSFTEGFLLHIDKLWQQMDLHQKQALQDEIYPEGLLVDKNNIRIANLASSFELIDEMNDVNSDLVTPWEVEFRSAE